MKKTFTLPNHYRESLERWFYNEKIDHGKCPFPCGGTSFLCRQKGIFDLCYALWEKTGGRSEHHYCFMDNYKAIEAAEQVLKEGSYHLPNFGGRRLFCALPYLDLRRRN